MRGVVLGAAGALLGVVAGLLYTADDPQLAQAKQYGKVSVNLSDPGGAVQRFTQLLRCRTVSSRDAANHAEDVQEFVRAHQVLREAYPHAWAALEVEQVADLSLLLRWPGANATLLPVLFISHLDVVPAAEDKWTHPPFAGQVADGYIWGRGAVDIKYTVAAMLEAVQELLRLQFQPARTLYLAFGHDEEVGGALGAGAIAALLAARGVRLEAVLDEGSPVISDGFPPFTRRHVALVSTAEKGYQSMAVEASSAGGHSSMPPLDGSSVPAVLARLINRVDRTPPPLRLVPPMTDFFRALAPAAAWRPLRLLLAHADRWPVAPLLAQLVGRKSAEAAALVRSTVAPTRLAAGVADNVLPQTGTVSFNARMLPGEKPDFLTAYLRASLGKDAQRARVLPPAEGWNGAASAVSPPSGFAWDCLSRAVHETLATDAAIVVAPTLLTGGTDSKHYANLTAGGTYRFMPIRMSLRDNDIGRVHGTDERCKVEDFLDAARFFVRLLLHLAGADQHGAALSRT